MRAVLSLNRIELPVLRISRQKPIATRKIAWIKKFVLLCLIFHKIVPVLLDTKSKWINELRHLS